MRGPSAVGALIGIAPAHTALYQRLTATMSSDIHYMPSYSDRACVACYNYCAGSMALGALSWRGRTSRGSDATLGI